jgi:hypothetical protein
MANQQEIVNLPWNSLMPNILVNSIILFID